MAHYLVIQFLRRCELLRELHKQRHAGRFLVHTHLLKQAVGAQHLSVVAGKENQAVIIDSLPLQLLQNPSHAVIQHSHQPQIDSPCLLPVLPPVTGPHDSRQIIHLKRGLPGIVHADIIRKRKVLRAHRPVPWIRYLKRWMRC